MLRLLFFAFASLLLFSCGNNDKTTVDKSVPVDSGLISTSQSNPSSPKDVVPALAELEKQHSLIPSNPALAYELAYAYAEQKDPKALLLADSLIRAKAPEVEKAYFTKAYYYSQTGNASQAVKAFDETIAVNYNFLDAHLEKGRLLFHQKQYGAALKAFATGQKISPKEAMFYFWMAKTQEAMGDKKNAKTNYENAYVLDKSLTEAREAAAKL